MVLPIHLRLELELDLTKISFACYKIKFYQSITFKHVQLLPAKNILGSDTVKLSIDNSNFSSIKPIVTWGSYCSKDLFSKPFK